MQNDARRNELIKAKLKELEELEATADPRDDLYEETPVREPQEPQMQEPQEKYYDGDQLVVAMWCETINGILQECPMSEYKYMRLVSVRNRLLYEMDLAELIPRPPESQEVPQEPAQMPQSPTDTIKDVAEPEFRNQDGAKDLEIISQKLKDIDSKKGLLDPPEPEPEPSKLSKLLGSFGPKKTPADRTVSEEHQPMSMG